MKIYKILCMILLGISADSHAGRNNRQSPNNLRFQTNTLQQFKSKRSGKLEMAGLLSQLAGNTLNQIGQATGNKELQIAGFATNQMGVNASAINSFRQKDGSFSKNSKQKQKNYGNNQGQQNQNNFQPAINRSNANTQPMNPNDWNNMNQGPGMNQNKGQNNFQPPINMPVPQPVQSSPWQNINQNQGQQGKNRDLLDVNLPAQNVTPPVQMQKPGVNVPLPKLAISPSPVTDQKINNQMSAADMLS